jgi:hypothetical protein
MSTLIKDGSHVIEMFASSFEDFIKINTKDNEFTRFSLNVKDAKMITFSCISGSASEYIEFIDALDAEIKYNDIAIVIATDYRYYSDETTIFVVCNDR